MSYAILTPCCFIACTITKSNGCSYHRMKSLNSMHGGNKWQNGADFMALGFHFSHTTLPQNYEYMVRKRQINAAKSSVSVLIVLFS